MNLKNLFCLLAVCFGAVAQPFKSNTFTTNQNLGFTIISTNFSMPGIFRAHGGAFTNSLTLNGSPVSTNGGSGITNSGMTLNTLQKATGTNSIGDSSITDDGSTVRSTVNDFSFGSPDGTVVTFQVRNNTNGNGGRFVLRASEPGVAGNAGDITFQGTDGLGGSGVGSSITFTAGQGDGGDGEINFSAPGPTGRVNFSAPMESVFNTPIVRPSAADATDLGSLANRWLNLYTKFARIKTEMFAQAVTVTNDVNVGGSVTLSGQTGFPYTDDGTQLLRNGVAIGGGTSVYVNGTNVSNPNLKDTSTVTFAIASATNVQATAAVDTTGTNIITLTQTGTNISAMDFSLVQNGGIFKLSLTNNAFIPTPANVSSAIFRHCWLAVQQPSTGTCLVAWTNGSFSGPEGQTLLNDTNNGAIVYYELLSDPFTNGLVQVWMSTKMKRMP